MPLKQRSRARHVRRVRHQDNAAAIGRSDHCDRLFLCVTRLLVQHDASGRDPELNCQLARGTGVRTRLAEARAAGRLGIVKLARAEQPADSSLCLSDSLMLFLRAGAQGTGILRVH